MTVHAPKIGLPIARPALRVWIPTLLWIAALCAVFGLVFQYEIRGAVRVWDDSTAYNHCYLVLPLAGALLWMRRDVLAHVAAGAVMVAAAAAAGGIRSVACLRPARHCTRPRS